MFSSVSHWISFFLFASTWINNFSLANNMPSTSHFSLSHTAVLSSSTCFTFLELSTSLRAHPGGAESHLSSLPPSWCTTVLWTAAHSNGSMLNSCVFQFSSFSQSFFLKLSSLCESTFFFGQLLPTIFPCLWEALCSLTDLFLVALLFFCQQLCQLFFRASAPELYA